MSVPSAPPPTYTQQEQEPGGVSQSTSPISDAQLLICPPPNASTFQNGFLGVSGEHASIEGEIQIKGVPVESWESVSIALTSSECSNGHKVELNTVEVELYSRGQPFASTSSTLTPASIPFSIPLTPDTPQCVHTRSGQSALVHFLVATLRTTYSAESVMTRTAIVHIRRFSSHGATHPIAPQSRSLSEPTPVDIQVSRTVYSVDEVIPIYVTIPPPSREVVIEEQIILRNVWVELIRTITSLRPFGPGTVGSTPTSSAISAVDTEQGLACNTAHMQSFGHNVDEPNNDTADSNASQSGELTNDVNAASLESVVARSGSACRFHSTKPIRLRLLMHGLGLINAQYSQMNNSTTELASQNAQDSEYNAAEDDDANCASITQTTVLHSVQFRLQVRIAFLQLATRTEYSQTVSIPITLVPPPAPLPEIDPMLDSAYRKKHDRPPLKTTRREDSDSRCGNDDLFLHSGSNQAGPSAIAPASIAPPPFDDEPPPFSSTQYAGLSFTDPTTSSSSQLPTFLESETEVILPQEDHPAAASSSFTSPRSLSEHSFDGEGVLYGFTVAEQYDGYSYVDDPAGSVIQDMNGTVYHDPTPPPSIHNTQDDTDVTSLISLDMHSVERAIDTLNIAYEGQEDVVNIAMNNFSLLNRDGDGELPPPPPPLDDPSDPPPAIDIEFRSSLNTCDINTGQNMRPPIDVRSIHQSPVIANLYHDVSQRSHENREDLQPLVSSTDESVADVEAPVVVAAQQVSGQDSSLAPPPYLNPIAFRRSETQTEVEHVTGPPPYVDFAPREHD